MAQPVEPRGVVAAQPAAEQVGLPRHRGGLEALQLLDHGEQPGLARELGAGRDVLPAQQEAHEVLGGAGSTPPRRVRREYECMRASSRRDTHSVVGSPVAV